MATVKLRTLGECAIETEKGRFEPDAKMTFGLGLYLILERGKRIPRQALVDLFWPEPAAESQARHRFRQALVRLRHVGIPVTARQEHVSMDPRAVEVDCDTLVHMNGEAERMLETHASLEFLPGYSPAISEQFAVWLELHRARVHTAAERVFLHALQDARKRGDWPAIERLAVGCLRVDPYNEEATMARAEATVMRGSKVQALAILDSYMEALGEKALAIGLPAKALRSRIADRVRQPKYATLSEKHFVGRKREFAELTQLLDQARQGSGGAAVIWGEPGIGKTRLLQEVTTAAELSGARVVTVRCQPTDAERPLSVFIDSVPVLQALPGSLGVSTQSVSLLRRLTGHGADDPEIPSDVTDAGVRSAAMRRALFDLFDAVAHENTLMYVVEDVHWADRQSLNVLVTLAEWSVRHHVAVVLSSRQLNFLEQIGATAETQAPFRVRHLSPLSSGHAQELLTQLASDQQDAPSADMTAWCMRVAEGNPYHLRELLTHWLETHELFGVPKPLMELLERRVGSLSPEALRLLQVCVTFGSLCTLERLEAVSVASGPLLLAGLEELGAAEIVVADENKIRVKHELLTRAAEARLTEPAKRLMHRRVATVLEGESVQHPSPVVLWECARHWEGAGEPERAVGLLDICCKHLLRLGLPGEAAELYRKAFEVRVPRFDQRVALYEGLIAALRFSGLPEQVLSTAAELRTEARRANHELEEHSWLELTEIEATWRTGGADDRTLEQLHRCLGSTTADATHRLNAAFWLLALAQNLGRMAYVEHAWRLVEPLVVNSAGDAIARAQVAMVYHADWGSLEEAVDHAEALVMHTRHTKDPVALVRALRNAGVALRRAGRWIQCKSCLSEAFETAAQYHVALGASDAAHMLSAVFLQEGDLASAESWLRTAEGWLHGCEGSFQYQDILTTRVRFMLATGELEAAEKLMATLTDPRTATDLRYRQIHSAFTLALGAADTPPQIDTSVLATSRSIYSILKDRGNQDFPVEALARALVVAGDRESGTAVLADYLTESRRDRGPVPPGLQSLADELAVVGRD